jgi:CBS domain-containing protein
MRVSDVMTKRVISITPEATILEAIKIMLKNHISGMPVIDGKGFERLGFSDVNVVPLERKEPYKPDDAA